MRSAGALALALAALLSGCANELGELFVDAGATVCAEEDASLPEGCPLPDDFQVVPTPPSIDAREASPGTRLVTMPLCSPRHRLSLQLYPGNGVLDELVAGDYDLGEPSEHSFATCGVCVRLFADVDGHGEPTRTYMATGGTLHLLATGSLAGQKLVANLESITFREVTIDPQTLDTQAVGTCTSRILLTELQASVRPLR